MNSQTDLNEEGQCKDGVRLLLMLLVISFCRDHGNICGAIKGGDKFEATETTTCCAFRPITAIHVMRVIDCRDEHSDLLANHKDMRTDELCAKYTAAHTEELGDADTKRSSPMGCTPRKVHIF